MDTKSWKPQIDTHENATAFKQISQQYTTNAAMTTATQIVLAYTWRLGLQPCLNQAMLCLHLMCLHG